MDAIRNILLGFIQHADIILYTVMYQDPNYVWHMDGYDKLSQYGFNIHGCADG